jgi:hypothetical protein
MTQNQDGPNQPDTPPPPPPETPSPPPPTEVAGPQKWRPRLVPEEVKGSQGERIERRDIRHK